MHFFNSVYLQYLFSVIDFFSIFFAKLQQLFSLTKSSIKYFTNSKVYAAKLIQQQQICLTFLQIIAKLVQIFLPWLAINSILTSISIRFHKQTSCKFLYTFSKYPFRKFYRNSMVALNITSRTKISRLRNLDELILTSLRTTFFG